MLVEPLKGTLQGTLQGTLTRTLLEKPFKGTLKRNPYTLNPKPQTHGALKGALKGETQGLLEMQRLQEKAKAVEAFVHSKRALGFTA